MTAITLPLWIYLLAISGIGNISASFSSKPSEYIVEVDNESLVGVTGGKIERISKLVIISSGGGGQSVDQPEISFGENTNRADV